MLFFNLLFSLAFATPDRLSILNKNLSQSDKIFLSQGMAAVVQFPTPIIEVRVGNAKVLKAFISQTSPTELSLFMSEGNQGPTNLIVKADKRVYVFDVIPSQTMHQDFIRITNGYGAPSHSDMKFMDGAAIGFKKSDVTADHHQKPQQKVPLE